MVFVAERHGLNARYAHFGDVRRFIECRQYDDDRHNQRKASENTDSRNRVCAAMEYLRHHPCSKHMPIAMRRHATSLVASTGTDTKPAMPKTMARDGHRHRVTICFIVDIYQGSIAAASGMPPNGCVRQKTNRQARVNLPMQNGGLQRTRAPRAELATTHGDQINCFYVRRTNLIRLLRIEKSYRLL